VASFISIFYGGLRSTHDKLKIYWQYSIISMAQFSFENRLRAITMNISEVNLMASKKENHHSSSKHDQSAKLGKSLCNGSVNMR